MVRYNDGGDTCQAKSTGFDDAAWGFYFRLSEMMYGMGETTLGNMFLSLYRSPTDYGLHDATDLPPPLKSCYVRLAMRFLMRVIVRKPREVFGDDLQSGQQGIVAETIALLRIRI